MVVKKCDEKHIPELILFYKSVLKYLKENINYPKWSDQHPNEKDVTEAVINGRQYICLDNEEIVGAFMLSEDPEGYYEAGDWSMALDEGEFLVVHILAVSPDRYRKGVGSLMVDKCISVAKTLGYKAIRLDVVPGNYPAAELYTNKGFVFAGTKDLRRGYEEIPVFDLYELKL